MLQGLLLFTALYYMPFFLTAVLSKSPINSGLDLFPATVLLLPGSAVVSLLITRLGHFRIFVWAGWSISCAGAALLILLDPHTKTWYWAPVFGIFRLGMGIILSIVNFATQANASVRDAGRAAAMYAFMRSLGIAISVAMGSVVFQNLMSSRLAALGLETDIAKVAESYVTVLRRLEVTDPTAAGFILSAYVRGFWGVWFVMTALCGMGFALSLCFRHKGLNRRIDSQYSLDRTGQTSRSLEVAWVGMETGERESRNLEQGREWRAESPVVSIVQDKRLYELQDALRGDPSP